MEIKFLITTQILSDHLCGFTSIADQNFETSDICKGIHKNQTIKVVAWKGKMK